MSVYDHDIHALNGTDNLLGDVAGKTALFVNVASKCGLTPQYEQLQALQDRFGSDDFTVVGFPCNQFMEQEPGSADEIAEFCEINYGVSFPIFAKLDVNGPDEHPLYTWLKASHPGDISWNFAKFLVGRDGKVAQRFAPDAVPESLLPAIEQQL